MQVNCNKMAISIILALIFVFAFFFVGWTKPKEDIVWGVNFSQKYCRNLGIDWKETYTALLDDLGARNIKIAVHWDLIHPNKDVFSFDDLDWQIKKAQDSGAKVMLVIGMKTPRWPECHIPNWASQESKQAQQEEILKMIQAVVLRYKDNPAVAWWQVENEPFFKFGECPWKDDRFLAKEVTLVRKLDSKPIVISDSGEWSMWFRAASLGDIPATTMYRIAWMDNFKMYFNYPYPPIFYKRKADLVKLFLNKEVICGELQAEPWGPKTVYEISLEEQKKTMNKDQFTKNIEFAKKTNLPAFYLWGGEWMYWMKIKNNDASVWEEAKKLFQ